MRHVLEISHMFPQSHLHSQTAEWDFEVPLRLITMSLPKRLPVKSLVSSFDITSLLRQPQLLT